MSIRLLSWVRRCFFPAPEVRPEPELPKVAIAPVPEPAVSARPSAVAILQNEPNLTAAELAVRAGVTLSYARSLIRRRGITLAAANKQKPGKVVAAQPQRQVRELANVAAAPMQCNRARVLDRNAKGVHTAAIADELGIPVGEAEFILKVARLKKTVKN